MGGPYKSRTLIELCIWERRKVQGEGERPNMARIKECLLGIHETHEARRREEFQTEISMLHATKMHDYIVELEKRIGDFMDHSELRRESGT